MTDFNDTTRDVDRAAKHDDADYVSNVPENAVSHGGVYGTNDTFGQITVDEKKDKR